MVWKQQCLEALTLRLESHEMQEPCLARAAWEEAVSSSTGPFSIEDLGDCWFRGHRGMAWKGEGLD